MERKFLRAIKQNQGQDKNQEWIKKNDIQKTRLRRFGDVMRMTEERSPGSPSIENDPLDTEKLLLKTQVGEDFAQ